MAGIIAAKTNNASRGVAGIGGGWGGQGFRIMALGIGNTPNSAFLDDAIMYAANHGADVITLCFTIPQTAAIDASLAYAVASGVPVVCSIGNDNSSTIGYPSSNANVIAVGSTDSNYTKSDFPSYGTGMFIAAPGRDIRSTTLTTYGNDNGTSLASPQVSAVLAILHQIRPSTTVAQFKNLLSTTADKTGGYNYSLDASRPGHSIELGYGRLIALKAVEKALGGPINGPSFICAPIPLIHQPPQLLAPYHGHQAMLRSCQSIRPPARRLPETGR